MSNHAEEPAVEGPVTIPVHQEQLRVETQTVDTGRGVRVSKLVTERPYQVDEVLHHDEVTVTHVPIDRIVAASDAPASRHDGDTLIIPVLEEVLVVERRVRIKEEIHITTVKHEQRHAETGMLKSEAVRVERFDEASES